MPTIVTGSSKGGCGKTTVSILLATELASRGYKVFLLDCDPNISVTRWKKISEKRECLPSGITVLGGRGADALDEDTIVDKVLELDVDGQIVIVDCQGDASRMVSRAIALSDLVITPLKAKKLDAEIGLETIRLVKSEEKLLRRYIKHVFVMTMTSMVKTKEHKGIEASIIKQAHDLITPSLVERVPYSWLFSYGGSLYSLPYHSGQQSAINEAKKFTDTVLGFLPSADTDETMVGQQGSTARQLVSEEVV